MFETSCPPLVSPTKFRIFPFPLAARPVRTLSFTQLNTETAEPVKSGSAKSVP